MATRNDAIREAALSLLRRGLATQAEVADLAGVSRQVVHYWGRDIPDCRPAHLRTLWDKTLANRPPVPRFRTDGEKNSPLQKREVEI